ncbi:PE family protein [Mycobacteroides abscessus subsp. abscessus]|uniref:PE family protein n=1 Tax=Mycobacteroides abscessus TaxID=36809 RepID=UPI000929C2C3|nr:PE family protein [Mycobacteroides abscessus]SIJ21956.1 PE family protein [Mycobacteroides abscessus subsp. abscessus]SLH38681.1 PE family protein [Mycobacteroides abscessus subsp. abscessus]
MPELVVVPEGLAAASAQVAALTARLVTAGAKHMVQAAGAIPPAADPVSLKSSAGLIGESIQHNISAAMGNEELGRSSIGVAETAASYTAGDVEGATAVGAIAV